MALYVGKEPTPNGQYILGVDTAGGLSRSENYIPDYSCASVMEMRNEEGRLCLEKVAEWHGYIVPTRFAVEVNKLGLKYNTAWVVVETTGGLGAATLEALRNIHYYPRLYVDKSKPQQKNADPTGTRYGVDTQMNTKPLMVAAMQSMFSGGRLIIHDKPTLNEMIAFSQHKPEHGRHWRYEAADGEKDDRVLSVAFACYAVCQSPWLYDFDASKIENERESEKNHFVHDVTQDDTEEVNYVW